MNRKIINNFRKVVSAANHYSGFKVNRMTSSERYFGDLNIMAPTADEIEFEVEEVKIRMPFGHVAGRFWGPKNVQPIVSLHGWQDNAGTFDRLIPHLPRHCSFLALDLPGHGLSSRLPDGLAYHSVDNLYFLNLLMKEYNWSKITLMGHSMGAVLCFMFASTFPERVNFVVAIDALKPHIYNPATVASMLGDRVDNFLIADKRNQEKSEPPAYEYEELVDKLNEGTNGSVTKECCPYLLKRNIQKSEKHPQKYFFTRDSRLKNSFGPSPSQEISVELAKRIKMPYLFIKATESPYYERKMYYDQIIDILKTNPEFELHNVEATHHLHLTNPELVAPIISDFLNRYLTTSKL